MNGKKGEDAFTCVSGKGCYIVDYCTVGAEDFDLIDNFRVVTMSECIASSVGGGGRFDGGEGRRERWVKMRKIVPENYLQKEEEKGEIKALTSRVMQAGANQEEINDVYEELVEVTKQGVVEVSRKKS